jgi:hypothetical protein
MISTTGDKAVPGTQSGIDSNSPASTGGGSEGYMSPIRTTPAKFAKTIISNINGKALRYPKNLSQPLDLLIYVTHWRFLPNKAVLQLVAHELDKGTHPFSRVYFFTRHNASSGDVVTLFPNKEFIRGAIPAQLAQNHYVTFDPGSGIAINDGDNVGVRFNLSPATTKKLGFGQRE